MFYDFKPYVPVAKRLAEARRFAAKAAKSAGREPSPVQSKGRKLAQSFWGQAWCDHLNQFSDFANRLARGRTYLGNGSVVDLQIKSGLIQAIVAGSETYEIEIQIRTLAPGAWKSIKRDCANSVSSLLDLLQGRFDAGVMQRLVDPTRGLFPQQAEIEMECSCPDYAGLCKHLAAVIYGVGVRLDTAPELLFTLRNVDHTELIQQAVAAENLEQSIVGDATLAADDLSAIFGIDVVSAAPTSEKKQRASSKPKNKKTKIQARVGSVAKPPRAAKRK